MYIFRLKIHTHRRYVKKPSAETQVSTGANEKRFINKTYIYRFLKQRSFASSRGTHSKTGKNTMKPLIRILSLWLAALCFGACTDDDLIDGTPTPEPETGIVIRLSAGDLEQTRTELTSQANLHNVIEVYELLYQGHGDDATFYACDKLDWNPKDSTDNTGVQEQRKEFLLPQSENLAKGAYTVLCVGLDDESGKTYNLPEAIKSKTLSEAKATLAQGGKEAIAKSELFAGWKAFNFAPDSLNIVEVEMKRRVAGVICYLTDIPYELTISGDNGGTYRVTKVQVCLYKDQHSEISLLRKEIEGKGYPADFGSKELANSNVLMEFPLENQGYSKQQDKNLYAIPQKEGLAPNSLLGGVYMLPIDKDEQKNTIEVKILGKVITSSGENPAEGAEEIEIANFPAINDDIDFEATEGSTKNYPIRPNLIYHIGDKPSDEEEGTPESLAGTEVKIGVKCWENETVDVEFPSVPLNLTLELVDSSDKSVYNTEKYVFDCIGSTKYQLHINRSVLYENWKVYVELPTSDDHMIYLYNKETNEYESSIEGSGEDYIDIVMTDYAVYYSDVAEEEQPKDRNVTIKLIGMQNGHEVGDPETLIVKQYNAIIVPMKDSNNDYRGFSHFDVGTERNLETGEITENNTYVKWKYHNQASLSWYWKTEHIYGYLSPSNTDGSKNCLDARTYAEKEGGFCLTEYEGSAMQKALFDNYKVNTVNGTLEINYWYLPAIDELYSFLDYANNQFEKCGVAIFDGNKGDSTGDADEKNYNCYWSSTAQVGIRLAFACRINSDSSVESSSSTIAGWDARRNFKYRLRQCCNVIPQKKYQQ